jgi:ribonuclease G
MRQLLWDAGAGEIRAGLLEDGKLVEFRLIRLRRGERLLIAAGEQYTARIKEKLPGGSALVTLGGGEDAVLDPCPPGPEGRLIAVEMIRSPIPEPARWKRAKVRAVPDMAPSAEPCWHPGPELWEAFLIQALGEVDEVICPTLQAAHDVRSVTGDAVPVHIDPAIIADADFEGLIDRAVSGDHPFPGGMLAVDRTRAMTMIDVDGVGDALMLNRAAAKAIPPLLRLFDIGGPVAIDFISMRSKADRAAVDAVLAEACTGLGLVERTAINGFGLCQIIRPRFGPSVPELLCGTTPGRLSLESRAIALLRDAQSAIGHGTRRLVAPSAIIDLIRSWPEEILALQSALGVAILLVPDDSVTGYGHVHVHQS